MDQANPEASEFHHPFSRENLPDAVGIHIAADSDQFFLTRKIVCDGDVDKIPGMKNLFHPHEMGFDKLLEFRTWLSQVSIRQHSDLHCKPFPVDS